MNFERKNQINCKEEYDIAEVFFNIIGLVLEEKYPGLTKKLKFSGHFNESEQKMIFTANYSIEDNKILDLKDVGEKVEQICGEIKKITPHPGKDRIYGDIPPSYNFEKNELVLALKNENYPKITDKYRDTLLKIGRVVECKRKSRSIKLTTSYDSGPVAQ